MDTKIPPRSSRINEPNPRALGELLDRYLWFIAKRELEKREKRLKGRNRASSIKI